MSSIIPVVAEGPPTVPGSPAEGSLAALKLAGRDALARETMAREVDTFALLQVATPNPPCPQLIDVVEGEGGPIGLVMEWCPTDMERWWDRMLVLPDAMEPLCGALADVCRRVAEYHAIMAARGVRAVHADIKPRNAVLAKDGRWLLTDFGAAKSRPIEQETWEATRLILGTENFIAPEMIFNARKHHPEAMDTWSIGATFFALLRMRRHRLFGQELPLDGTHNILFRCRRMSTVTDLHERQPALFVGRDLDPTAFHSPDRLPEEDRQAVAQALLGLFGEPDARREAVLEREVLALLDQALAVDPGRRFTRAEDMSRAFDRVVQRYWELEGSLEDAAADRSATRELTETETMRTESEFDEARPTVVEPDPARLTALASEATAELRSPAAAPGERPPAEAAPLAERTVLTGDPGAPAVPDEPEPSAPPPTAVAFGLEEAGPAPSRSPSTLIPPAEASARPACETWAGEAGRAPDPVADERVLRLLEGIQAQLVKRPAQRPSAAAGTPFWMVLAIGLLLFCQAIQFGLLLALFLSTRGPATTLPDAAPVAAEVAAPAPAASAEVVAADPPGPGEPVPADEVPPPAGGDPEPAPAEVAAAEAPPAPAAPPEVAEPAPAAPKAAAPRAATAKPAATEPARQKPTASARPAAIAKPTAAARPAADPPATTGDGSVEVLGAEGYVVGAAGRKPCGPLAPGTYEVFAQPSEGSDYVSLGVHSLGAGERMAFRCGFGSCKRIQ